MRKKLYVKGENSSKINLPLVLGVLDKPINAVVAMHLICKPDNSYQISKLFRTAVKEGKWNIKGTFNLQYQGEVNKALNEMKRLNVVIGQPKQSRGAIRYRLNPLLFCSEFMLEPPRRRFQEASSLSEYSQTIGQYEKSLKSITKGKRTGWSFYDPYLMEIHLDFIRKIFKSEGNLELINRINSAYKKFDYFTLIIYFKDILEIVKNWFVLKRLERNDIIEENGFFDFKRIYEGKVRSKEDLLIKPLLKPIEDAIIIDDGSIEKIIQFLEKLINRAIYIRTVTGFEIM